MKLYRTKQKYVAWQVNFDKKDEPDWLKRFIEAGAIYQNENYYIIAHWINGPMDPRVFIGEWLLSPSLVDPSGLIVLSDPKFKERFELAGEYSLLGGEHA